MSATPAPTELPLAPGIWNATGNWYLYKDQKYWHKDVEIVADDMRRDPSRLRRNSIHRMSDELKAFVHKAFDREDYRVLGVPLDDYDYEFLKKLGSKGSPLMVA